jgi:alkylation response protein AidB-like acyl-CoA dehydrogenase
VLTVELELTDEQRLLGETIDGLLGKRYDASTRLALLSSPRGWSRDLWRQYAELGLLGLTVPEEYGGAGMGIAELAVVMESFGRALVLEPFLSTVVFGAGLIAAAGSAGQRDELLPKIAAGDALVAFAYAERGSRWSLSDIKCYAEPDGDAVRLHGEKISVLGGDSANYLIVTARTTDGQVGLFLAEAAASGITAERYAMQDGLRGADIVFDGATAVPLGPAETALATVESVFDVALAALCAEAVGAMDRMLWLTVDYLKARVQFGQPISSFQVLQHRAADMYVSLDQARSSALVARLAVAEGDAEARGDAGETVGAGDTGGTADAARRRRTVRAAKLVVDTAARHVGQEAIQLHGGIGMTMEYQVGHYFRRTSVIARTIADADLLTEQVGAAGGLY